MAVFRAGDLVWASLRGGKMWPGVIVEDDEMTNRKEHYCVFWLGDYRRSHVHRKNIVPFALNFGAKYKSDRKVTYVTAVMEAISECAARSQKVSAADKEDLLKWAEEGFRPHLPDEKFFPPDPANPFPEIVVSPHKLRAKPELTVKLPDSAVQRVLDGHVSIDDICIACNRSTVSVDCLHPLFEGGLCTECKEDLKSTLFISDENGTNDYCTICGYEGDMVICDNVNRCTRVYCRACITILVGPDGFLDAQRQEPWHCYICDGRKHGLLKMRHNWRENLLQFYRPISKYPVLDLKPDEEKKPIRVLSLFHAVLSGKVALESLGVAVDKYYATDSGPEVPKPSSLRSPNGVIHLGDVGNLSEAKVKSLCPIDLLISVSPSGENNATGSKQKGTNDVTATGFAFFEFYRIIETLLHYNGQRQLFWLYENDLSMPRQYKDVISRYLRCEPALIESRYFWGNIPGLYNVMPSVNLQSKVTQSALVHKCNGALSNGKKLGKIATRKSRRRENYVAAVNGNDNEDGNTGIHTGCDSDAPVMDRVLNPLRNYFSNAANHKSKKSDCGPSGEPQPLPTKRRLRSCPN